jgi:methionyl-tRNA synthetase
MVLTEKYFDGKVPAAGVKEEYEVLILQRLVELKKEVENNIEVFRFREALKSFIDIARLGNKYLADTEPWKLIKTDPEKVKTILHYSLQIAAVLSVVGQPFIPFTSEKLRAMLNISDYNWETVCYDFLLSEGQTLQKSELLFEKIEDPAIELQIEKLKRPAEESKTEIVPAKENISYDDFCKMDIRNATILAAEKVPKTQKLIKLTVDCGIDTRTVVSGVAEHFEPEQLVGKKVVLLANLEPRMIKGVESKGMILFAESSDGKLRLVSPDEEAHNGSIIK